MLSKAIYFNREEAGLRKMKTIIIDDEKLSAEGINSMMRMLDLETETVGVFYSSKKALAYLKEHDVDLVITDINMPEINGLELILEMKRANNKANVIIITGFGSLKYAQEAMRYGVRYFLQKPCSLAELKESVQNCIEDIGRHQREYLLYRKDLIEQAIFGKRQNDGSGGWEFSLLMYQDIFFDTIDSLIRKLLEKYEVQYISGGIRDVVAYYVFSDVPQEVLDTLTGLQVPLIINYRKNLTLDSIQKGFESGRRVLEFSFYYDESIVINENNHKNIDVYKRLPLIVRRFEKEMRSNDFTIARESLRELFSLCRNAWLPPRELKNIVTGLAKDMIENFDLEEISEEWLETVLQAEFSKTLYNALLEIVDQVEIKEENELMGNKISTNLNLMIEKYYDNSELSLRWISKNILYLNPEYLGKVYLKETGEKFTAKLQEVRLKKAAEFLEEGYKIYEVAKVTGYENNPNYFGRLFRQRFGMTPREYRKKHE